MADLCHGQPQDFCAAEREGIGADHQAFGAALGAKWKFPPGLRAAISYHHRTEKLKPEFKRVVTAISVADTICCQNEIGFYLTGQVQEVTDESLEAIGVSEQQVAELLEDLPERIQETEQIFSE